MGVNTDDLFNYKRESLYEIARTEGEERHDLTYDYRDTVMKNSLSDHLFRKENIYTFLIFVNDFWVNLIDTTKKISLFKAYSVSKNYRHVN